MAANDSVVDILQVLEKALRSVQGRTKGLGISLVRARVSLKLAAKHDTSAKVDLGAWVPVTLGADYSGGTVQSMVFTLIPAGGHLDLGGDFEASDLAESIVGVAKEIGRINSSIFNLDETNLSLEFAISQDGGVKVIGLGYTRTQTNTHGLDLWFRKIS